MTTTKKPKDYLRNENLLKEIIKSQEIQSRLPEDEREERAAECLTPELVEMLMMLVDRYGTHYRWRGYTWNEDMRAEALLSLCKVALKFDLNKAGDYPNPFGYYTQIVKRVFLTYIEKEKKQTRIKDEIIEMSEGDMLPSFGRQNEETANSLGVDLDGTKDIESDPRRRKRKSAKKSETTNMSEREYQRWLDDKVKEFEDNPPTTPPETDRGCNQSISEPS